MTALVRPLILLALLLGAAPASAANGSLVPGMSASDAPSTAATVAPPSPNDVRELLRLLGDERVSAWLRQRAAEGDLPGETAAEAGASLQEQFRLAVAHVQARLAANAAAWSALPGIETALRQAWAAEVSTDEALRSVIYVIIFLFVGAGLEWLYWRYLGGTLRRIELAPPTTLGRSVMRALARAALIGGGILLFALGSVGTFSIFAWTPFVEPLVLSLLLAVVAGRALSTLALLVLAPRVDELRLVPLDRPRARLLYRWVMAVGLVGVVGLVAVGTLERLALAPSAMLAVATLGAAGLALTLIAAIWHLDAARRRSNHPEATATATRAPRNLGPMLWSALILAAFGLWLMGATAMMWTVLILAGLLPAAVVVRAMVDHLFDRAEAAAATAGEGAGAELPEPGEAPAADEQPGGQRYATHRPIVVRLARFVLVILAVLGLGLAFGVNVLSLSTSPTTAGRAFGVVVDLTVALLIADLVWVWAKTAIDRRMANYQAPEPGHAPGPEARMATLLPLFRKVLLVTVVIMVILIALSSLGVNIGPLLAGAGVAGIAIGFGAQALVRDIVSGVFFLIDDAFRVGEYIEMGELRGTVEAISIRSLRVRHHRGAVHTIPFGEMKSLTNYSRDWVVMKLEFRVPFDTDLQLVKKIIKKIGAELQANPDYGQYILDPLKSQGVRRMEEFNMVIGVKFMATPGEQWTIRRDAYQQIRDAFDAAGITFAHRNVKVEVVGDPHPSEAVRKAAIGAAQDAIEAQEPVAAAQR
jgi:small-conductance mechanosensitive channel